MTQRVPVGDEPEGGTVGVVDVPTHRVIATIPVPGDGARPMGTAMSPDGRKLYTADGPSGEVSVIDPVRRVVVKRIRTGGSPRGVAVR
ncbi:MAG TPA: hypothetical protein VFL93_01925 [Longimicrobiaceae bacterium]|nr:hypothetical protein [Longimicrobiaceae bacterium]